MKAILEEGKFPGNPLNIVLHPDNLLKQKAEPITEFNQDLDQLAKDMLTTMYQAPGIGLAAQQIGLKKRIFVADVDFEREKNEGEPDKLSNFNPRVFINPEITKKIGDTTYEEGCLSIPGVYAKVHRSEKIILSYQDVKGDKCELEADGLLSICIQHELDHLNGVLFIDHLSQLKRNFHMKKYIKNMK